MKKVISIILFSLISSSSICLHAQWEQTSGPGGGNITAFAVIGTNLFAGTNGGGVFLSTNNGKSWTRVNKGLPANTCVQCLAANGTNLFAGTGKGVFLSTDNGTSWTIVNSGLPSNTCVCSLAVNREYLFAGTSERDVWRLPLSGLSIE